MRNRLLIFGAIFLSGLQILSGQENQTNPCPYYIKGRVFDLPTKEPLSFVNIQIEGTTLGATSDDQGNFEINQLCDKEYDLLFSQLGYKIVRHHHDFHHPFMEVYLAPEAYTLESVVIEDEHSHSNFESLNNTILNQDEISKLETKSLGDIVSKVAGVGILKTGQNISQPIIHGLHSDRVLLINNGIRHEYQSWGSDHAPEIATSDLEQIEVVKGAATVRYGPDALGGVIIVDPNYAELSSPLEVNLTASGETNGRAYYGKSSLNKGFKWLSVHGGGSYLKQGDLQAPDYNLSNTGREEYSIFGGARIHPLAELDVWLYGSHFDQKLGILSGSVFSNLEDLERAIGADEPLIINSFTYDITQPFQEVAHSSYKMKTSYVLDHQSISLQYAYQKNHRQEFAVRRSDAPNIDLILTTHTADLNWHHPHIWSLEGNFGLQWLSQNNENQPGTGTVPFIPNYDEERLGGYLIESMELGKGELELGIRYDYQSTSITGREPDNTIYRNTVTYNNLSGTLGYAWDINEKINLRSNIGTAWRAPNMAELYRFGQNSFFIEYGLWRYTVDDQFDFISTREGILTEEDRSVPSEVGYKWINTFEFEESDRRLELVAYINYIDNYIYSKPAGVTRTARGVFPFYIIDQTEALFWGVDLSSELDHSEFYSSALSGSILWSKQIDRDDNLSSQPPPNLSYTGTFRPNVSWLDLFTVAYDLDYTFEQFLTPRIISVEEFLSANSTGIQRFGEEASDFDLLTPPEGYLLLNIELAAKIGNWKVSCRLENALNTSYRSNTDRLRYFSDETGRNFQVRLDYTF